MPRASQRSDFHAQMVAMHRAIYRRNQARIQAAVADENQALRDYEQRYKRSMASPRRVLDFAGLIKKIRQADVSLLGDYHTLPQAQRSMLRILRSLDDDARSFALAVEFVETRHQDALDAFMAGRIGEKTFLRRIQYHQHWPYGDFAGLRELCDWARQHQIPMFGIDVDAASGASLQERDDHAAAQICAWQKNQPGQQVLCLIGELHLAPAHLPRALRVACAKPLRVMTVHQNAEQIYHALERKGIEQDANVVELTRWRYALNSVPPLICQQSFLRWLDEDDEYQEAQGMREAFFEQARLIGELLELDVETALEQVRVETFLDLSFLQDIFTSEQFSSSDKRALREQIHNSESYYIPRIKTVYLGTPSANHSSEEAAHFLRDVFAGENSPHNVIEAFYDRAMNEALAFLGSKLVNHRRKALHEAAFKRMQTQALAQLEAGEQSARPDLELARLVLAHKRLERGHRGHKVEKIFAAPPRLLDAVAHALGYMLGDRLYYALVRGEIERAEVRRLFIDPLSEHGAVVRAYFSYATRLAGVRVPRRA